MILKGTGGLQFNSINDDGSGFLYIGASTQLSLNTRLESCTQVYNQGTLAVANNGTSKFVIQRHLNVYGLLDIASQTELYYGEKYGNLTMQSTSSPSHLRLRSLTIRPNSGLILMGHASGSWSIEMDSDKSIRFEDNTFFLASNLSLVKANSLEILQGAKVRINEGYSHNATIQVQILQSNGDTYLGVVNLSYPLTGHQRLLVGQSGQMHLRTDRLDLSNFVCNGSMVFSGNLQIVTNTFDIGPTGKVLFTNKTSATVLQAHTIYVEGVFSPGLLSTGSGWQLLSIGPLGDFKFSTNNTVVIDILKIAGKLAIGGPIKLQKRDYSGKSLISIESGGSFILDNYSPCVNGTKFNGTSEILALNVTINGVFYAGRMNIGVGWDNLVVGSRGDLAFIPSGHVKIDQISVSGKLRTDTKVVIQSKAAGSEEMRKFHVNQGGLVQFNCAPLTSYIELNSSQNSTELRSTASQLFAKDVDIKGMFNADRLYMGLGWDRLYIGAQGSFTVYPIGWYSFDYCTIDGKFTSLSHLEIEGKSAKKLPLLRVGTTGHLKSVTNNTDILVEHLLVEGTFETGLLSIGTGLIHMNVTGSMTFNQTKQFLVNTTVISGSLQTWMPFTSSGKFIGQSLVVTGTVKVDYEGVPQQSAGLTSSMFIVNNVTVSGSMLVGSLHLASDNVMISGVLSGSYGGALANKGPGAGAYSASGSAGGGHAGRGGRGNAAIASNLPYADIYKPGSWGSGGGSQPAGGGGRGGGRIQLAITNRLTLSGKISVNGQHALVRAIMICLFVCLFIYLFV